MAWPTSSRLTRLGAPAAALLCVGLLLPASQRSSVAWRSPAEAAGFAEDVVPPLGLPWGRARAHGRDERGWRVVWQPAHGAWLVTVCVPDTPDPLQWRIDAASWLPGARLSRAVAHAWRDRGSASALSSERLARRDWQVGDSRLVGALPAGGTLPAGSTLRWPAFAWLLAGLALAGVLGRRLVAGIPSAPWRWITVAAGLEIIGFALVLSRVAPAAYKAEVRPWVTELSLGAGTTLLAGALIFVAYRFPVASRRAWHDGVPYALAVGVLVGRLAPATPIVTIAGLHGALLLWPAVIVSVAWLACLAGEGARALLAFAPWSRWVVGVALVAATVSGGGWAGLALAVGASSLCVGAQAATMAAAALWGYVAGAISATCFWPEAQRDSLTLLLVGVAVVSAWALRQHRRVTPPTSGVAEHGDGERHGETSETTITG